MSGITELLRAEIAEQGPIRFARFMETALYHPGMGYYERSDRVVGRGGDFVTSVSFGDVFGELLGRQFLTWLKLIPGERVWLIEMGAHDGLLAADILSWVKGNAPCFLEKLGYLILEPSPTRQSWQRRRLEDFAGLVHWCGSLEEMPGNLRGVLFCNELFDAMPVRRLGWDTGRWFEWGVTVQDGRFTWERLSLREREAEALLAGAGLQPTAGLLEVLPKDFTIDLCPAAGEYWGKALGRLEAGKGVVIDYGLEADGLFQPSRREGTLRAYRKHTQRTNPLEDPGEQDLTAHVNFTQLAMEGEKAGWLTEQFVSQESFLIGIARLLWEDPSAGRWSASRKRQFATLCHPEQMGRVFRVLVQGRSVP